MTGYAEGRRSWQFDLPMTAPLSMNDRMHWRVKAKKGCAQ